MPFEFNESMNILSEMVCSDLVNYIAEFIDPRETQEGQNKRGVLEHLLEISEQCEEIGEFATVEGRMNRGYTGEGSEPKGIILPSRFKCCSCDAKPSLDDPLESTYCHICEKFECEDCKDSSNITMCNYCERTIHIEHFDVWRCEGCFYVNPAYFCPDCSDVLDKYQVCLRGETLILCDYCVEPQQ